MLPDMTDRQVDIMLLAMIGLLLSVGGGILVGALF
jgi:hypothetical protein